jgi:anti-sigma regulatory factor (Ser/Thr protein kinase)
MSGLLELGPTPDSVGRARRWAVAYAHDSGLTPVADTLSLLVSELVSNVVLHARTPCELRIDRLGTRVRVEVSDGSDRMPGPSGYADPLAQSGRGMVLVESLSTGHGVQRLPQGGKTVWFELAVRDDLR